MNLTVVILAAGKGSRMQSGLLKVLHSIGGKSMLEHVVQTAKKLNPKQILVIYSSHKNEMIEQVGRDASIIWVKQKEQKGTGDAVAAAMPFVDAKNRVLTLYADVPLIEHGTLRGLCESTPNQAVGLLTSLVDNPKGLGRILRNESGEVIGIREEKDAASHERDIKEINTGIFLLPAMHLNKWLPKLSNENAQHEYYLTDIIQMAVSDGVAIHTAVPGNVHEILGINDKAQLVAAERLFQVKLAHHYLKQGVLILDPNRFDLRGTLTAGLDVTIDVNVMMEGDISLGDRVKIEANCYLKNCQIGHDVQILGFCHLENVTIEQGAIVGPFARLRPGTKLGEMTRVGNFVEVKNSQVGSRSKINHLSYMGDALIGADVNIGAGTITCNYDGAKKHQTKIEDEAHIGSNSQLVAPVKVGAGATLAAGSTLVQDAPAYQLTMTHRLEQRSIDWQRPKKIEELAQTVEQ